MADISMILTKLSDFIEECQIDTIPVGNILIVSLSVGAIIRLAEMRVKGGK